MEVLFILIPLSLVFVVLIGLALYWAIRSGQYDDLERAHYQILLDDDDAPPAGEPANDVEVRVGEAGDPPRAGGDTR